MCPSQAAPNVLIIDRRLTQRNMPTEAYAYVGRDKRPPQETAPEKTEDSPKNE